MTKVPELKFILTKELGRLARWLRLLGFDTVYFDLDDIKKLFLIAFNENRIIVTKIRALSGAKNFKVVYVKSDILKDQIRELIRKIDIKKDYLFTRCADCNKRLVRVDKEEIKGFVPEYVYTTQRQFFRCPQCAKIFWRATHWDLARGYLNEIYS